jgi:hypothetical protein
VREYWQGLAENEFHLYEVVFTEPNDKWVGSREGRTAVRPYWGVGSRENTFDFWLLTFDFWLMTRKPLAISALRLANS